MHKISQRILSIHQRKPGILASLLKIFSFVLYAWNDALSKLLMTTAAHSVPTHSVVFYQYAISACLLSLVYLFRGDNRQQIVGLPYHMARVFLCTCGIVLLNWSFSMMPLSYAVGFNLLSPFITIIVAYFWFQEPLSSRKTSALALSMFAYLILLDSSRFSQDTPLSIHTCLLPSIALLCFQANTMLTKHLFRLGESNVNLTQLLFVCIPIILLPVEVFYPYVPSSQAFFILCLMAINGTLATLALHQAIAIADLTFLLPFGFLKYSIITFFGYIYFLEVPHISHLLGIGLTMSILFWLNLSDRKMFGPWLKRARSC